MKPLYNQGNFHFLTILNWGKYKQLHILENGPLVLGNTIAFGRLAVRFSSSVQGSKASLLSFSLQGTEKQTFFFKE